MMETFGGKFSSRCSLCLLPSPAQRLLGVSEFLFNLPACLSSLLPLPLLLSSAPTVYSTLSSIHCLLCSVPSSVCLPVCLSAVAVLSSVCCLLFAALFEINFTCRWKPSGTIIRKPYHALREKIPKFITIYKLQIIYEIINLIFIKILAAT